MDQHSFEQGILLGLRTSIVVLNQNHLGPASRPVRDEVTRIEAMIARRKNGCREMVEADIFLSRPVMAAADIGWPQ